MVLWIAMYNGVNVEYSTLLTNDLLIYFGIDSFISCTCNSNFPILYLKFFSFFHCCIWIDVTCLRMQYKSIWGCNVCTIYELQIPHPQSCNKSFSPATLHISLHTDFTQHVSLHVRLMKQMLRLGLGLNFSPFSDNAPSPEHLLHM